MYSVIKNIFKKIMLMREVSSRARVARELLVLSDQQLRDVGLSRVKLEEGVSAYPWRLAEAVSITTAKSSKQTEQAMITVHQENIAA
jgi:uncharacterized protein YjiS (DUF1127 family)